MYLGFWCMIFLKSYINKLYAKFQAEIYGSVM